MVGQTISHYRIVREIASGGMGVVYEAVDTLLDIPVAIKVIRRGDDPLAEERFLGEARAIASLDHPNVCGFREIDRTDDGQLFLVMAYLGDGSLRERLRSGPLSPYATLEVATAVLAGLACAHEAGVAHRDIKPGNLVYSGRYLKIVDFGLARLTGQKRRTRKGVSPGTVAYMSPEQLRGHDVDPRTDIWSLGIVLYQAVTGVHPFAAERDEAVGYRIVNDAHVPASERNPSVPRSLSSLIDRCLAKDPGKRYATATEALAACHDVARAERWGEPDAPTEPLHSPPPPSRWPVWVSLFATALVVVSVVVWRATRSPSVYVTEQRVAVLPFESRVGNPEERAFTAGLADVTSEILGVFARAHPSAWVVPFPYVLAARVTNPGHAAKAFGVNRVVHGSLQRYGDGFRLTLETTDPLRRRTIGQAEVDFDADEPDALVSRLPEAVAACSRLTPRAGERIATLLPSRAARDYFVGRGYLQRTEAGPEPVAAVDALRRVIDADPEFAPARAWAALGIWHHYQATADLSLRDEAVAVLEPVARIAAHQLDARALAGSIWFRLGDVEASIRILEPVVREDSTHIEALRDLARAYVAADRFDEAANLLERTIVRLPDCFVPHRVAGTHYYRVGDYELAIENLLQATTLAPDDGFSLNVLGGAYHQLGELDLAQRYWERSFQVWPTCDSSNNIGFARYRKGEYAESARYYEFALAYCDSTYDAAWGNLGRVLYLVGGRREEAIAVLEKAVRLGDLALQRARNDVATIVRLADYHSILGNGEVTRRMIARADSLGGLQSDAIYQLAVALETIGERDEALRRLATAFERGFPLDRAATDPWLDALRMDEAFRALVPQPL